MGISNSDTGSGVTDDELPHLFERFFRGKAGRGPGVPSTGLGLAAVKERFEQHAGQIKVESAGIPVQGSTFSIWFPIHYDIGKFDAEGKE